METTHETFRGKVDLTTHHGAVRVVGESYRQERLARLSAGRLARGERVKFTALLLAEDGNAYDDNAIMVLGEMEPAGEDAPGAAEQIGYLARADAAHYRRFFVDLAHERLLGHCEARLQGGTAEKPTIGAVLFLGDLQQCRAALRETLSDLELPEPENGWLDLTAHKTTVSLVGENECQEQLLGISRRLSPSDRRFDVMLEPRSDGAILASAGGDPVGRISKRTAAQYLPAFRALAAKGIGLTCGALLEDGTPDDPGIEVRLFLRSPEACERIAELEGAAPLTQRGEGPPRSPATPTR